MIKQTAAEIAAEKFDCELFRLEMREKNREIARLTKRVEDLESRCVHAATLLRIAWKMDD